MTPYELVREYFPAANDREVEFILWEKTGWPGFWEPSDGKTTEECLRKQLGELKAERDKANTAGG